MTALKCLLPSIGLSVVLAGFPVALGATTVKECKCGKPTAASYNWDFHGEANRLFASVQADAQHIIEHAEQLESDEDDANVGWQSQVADLRPLKREVNDIAEKLCRLEVIRRVVAPWQQKTIDHIAANLPLMVDNAQDAIVFVNGHQDDLMSPEYWRYADNLDTEASNLARSVGAAVKYARVSHEYHNLKAEIGTAGTTS